MKLRRTLVALRRDRIATLRGLEVRRFYRTRKVGAMEAMERSFKLEAESAGLYFAGYCIDAPIVGPTPVPGRLPMLLPDKGVERYLRLTGLAYRVAGGEIGWNDRYMEALERHGLLLYAIPPGTDWPTGDGYNYPSGLPTVAPRPTDDAPDRWPVNTLILWADHHRMLMGERKRKPSGRLFADW